MHDTILGSDRYVGPVPEEAAVEETKYRSLVWVETNPGVRDLLGFADVTDWDGMADELRKRGINHGAIYGRVHFPEFTSEST